MKRALAVLAALSVVGTAQGADWSSLWLNADQRGERLMQDGKAAEAAQTYRDPRRRAYARLAAGDYQAAARGFEALAGTSKRSDDRYNQGNALAHAGDLQGAINAYDAALALDPGNTDAAHNRKLVEEALKQRQQQSPDKHQQSSPGEGQSQKPRNGQSQDQHGQPPSESAKSGTPPPAGQARQDDQQAGRQGGTQKPSGSAQSAHERKPDDQSGNEGRQAANVDRAAEREQARQDARASAPKPAAAGSPAPEGGQSQPLPAARDISKPPSEQQLAEDQWLRRIPDDPGGLLRRKFMIEHLMRQQSRQ